MVAQVHFSYAQTASILPPAKTTFNDSNGKPLVSGTVDFYIPGTTTRKTTWQDAAETIPNANPVVLDAAGRALILGSGDYRQIVKDRLSNVIWDQVTSSAGSGGGGTSSIGDGNNVGTILPWSGFTPPQSYLFTYGQEISRTTYAIFLNIITLIQNATCTSGNATLTAIADTSQLNVGAAVEAACIPANSVIVSKTINSVTLNNLALVSVTNSMRFFPWGNGNGVTTFNVPDLRGIYLPGRNNMGGAASANLTNPFYTDPNSIAGGGGSQSHTILLAELAAHTHTITDPGHTHTTNFGAGVLQLGAGGNERGGIAGSGYVSSFISNSSVTGITQTNSTGSSTPISIIPPSKTINYVIKVLPNVASTSTVVTSIGGMTGDLICGTGLICAANTISASPSLIVGTTPISGATANSLLFNNGGVLGSTNNVNSALAVTSVGGVPSFSITLPNGLAMGTPASLVLTNATSLPIAGIAGLGTGIGTWLATPSSANLFTALTTKTGNTSPIVFSDAPALTGIPTAPTAAAGTNTTQIATTAGIVAERAATKTLTNTTLNSTGTGNVLQVSGVTVSAGQYPGEPSTGNATAGNVGQYVECNIATGSAVSLVTATAKTICTLAIPSGGDWDIDLNGFFNAGGGGEVVTSITVSLSLTTNTLDTTNGRFGQSVFSLTNPPTLNSSIPPLQFQTSGATSIFFVAQSGFSGGANTQAAWGIARARRTR